jgi:hypothetical protein
LKVFEITIRLKEQNLSNVRADDEPAVKQPGVANEVSGDSWGLGFVLSIELWVGHLELVSFIQVVELVDVFTCHEDYFVINVAERDLSKDLCGGSQLNLFSCKALLLIELPHDNSSIVAQCYEQLLICGTEVN